MEKRRPAQLSLLLPIIEKTSDSKRAGVDRDGREAVRLEIIKSLKRDGFHMVSRKMAVRKEN